MSLDPRIGVLNSGRYYCFPDGNGKPEFIGTLAEVESALGIPPADSAAPEPPAPITKTCLWTVVLSFQYPAYDEVEGIHYRDISASSKSAANDIARRLAANDGHLVGGKGRVTFTATNQKDSA